MNRGAAILGWGTALPSTIVTNADLEARLDTSDTWITERSGIRSRHIGGTTEGLATEAAGKALAAAGIDPAEVELLVMATTTPDQAIPATSAVVHHRLGLGGGAFDLNSACSGFVYALVTAYGLLNLGLKNVLVVGVDTLSRITNQDDRGTAVLFGDGAGAVMLAAIDGPSQLLGWDFGTDGSAQPILYCDHGGFIHMDGKEVFRRAVRVTVESAAAALTCAGVQANDIALFIPHQANLRIIDATCTRLGIPMERTAIVLDRTGNTSAASIPLALAEAADTGRIEPGDLVLMAGFGAGMTWASAVLRWNS